MEQSIAPIAVANTEKVGGVGYNLVAIELRKQLYLAGPLVVGGLLQTVILMISVMFVGHLGELALSSASIATSFAGVTGFSVLSGMASSLDTLCGQAFGAKQYSLVGIYKQRAVVVLTLVSSVVAVIWMYTGQILVLAGQDREIAMGAGSYIRWMIPALFVHAPLQCHVRFLQAQNIVLPVMLSAGVSALNHVIVCWLLVRKLGLGSKGAALANGISYLTNLSILALYVRLSASCTSTWTGMSKEAFRQIPALLRLAVPSALMVCLEWWSFELILFFSGLLPNPKLEASVLSISLNMSTLVFMISVGLGAAVSTRVSNELGAGRPDAARLATRVTMVLGVVTGTSVGVLIVLLRNLLGYAYSNEKEVVAYVARIMPVLAVKTLFNDLLCVLSGIVRGCGRQKVGACVNLGAYYIVGIPAALVFAFVFHLGGKGLWFGILCGVVVHMLLLLSITLSTSWEKEALKAKGRAVTSSEEEGPFGISNQSNVESGHGALE
uniref:Uncharacterized protein n=1 Tax=Avena sativa TaxID=4498 RepID=A0ACD5ZP58_AVESA